MDSGCVTSAETVLIQEQSYDKLFRAVNTANVVAVMLSPQSRASIADAAGLSNDETFLRIAAALKSIGVRYVIDASAGGDIALIEARNEFMHR